MSDEQTEVYQTAYKKDNKKFRNFEKEDLSTENDEDDEEFENDEEGDFEDLDSEDDEKDNKEAEETEEDEAEEVEEEEAEETEEDEAEEVEAEETEEDEAEEVEEEEAEEVEEDEAEEEEEKEEKYNIYVRFKINEHNYTGYGEIIDVKDYEKNNISTNHLESQIYIHEYLYKIIDGKKIDIVKINNIKVNWKDIDYLFGSFNYKDLYDLILSDSKNNINNVENYKWVRFNFGKDYTGYGHIIDVKDYEKYESIDKYHLNSEVYILEIFYKITNDGKEVDMENINPILIKWKDIDYIISTPYIQDLYNLILSDNNKKKEYEEKEEEDEEEE
jgi:hypothetical protein